jgi:hypothetical protein
MNNLFLTSHMSRLQQQSVGFVEELNSPQIGSIFIMVDYYFSYDGPVRYIDIS